MQLDLGKHGADHGHLQSNMNNHGNGIFTDANIVKQSCETNRAIGAIVVISMADRELKLNGTKMGKNPTRLRGQRAGQKAAPKYYAAMLRAKERGQLEKFLDLNDRLKNRYEDASFQERTP